MFLCNTPIINNFEQFFIAIPAQISKHVDNTAYVANIMPVSYTHLDVYKRQLHTGCKVWTIFSQIKKIELFCYVDLISAMAMNI